MFAGVCRKVKPSFCERGHSHNDEDATMGTVNTVLATKSIQNFEVFSKLVKQALVTQVRHVLFSEDVICVCDCVCVCVCVCDYVCVTMCV